MSPSIRARLTLWYAAVLAVVLTAFAGSFYAIHARARLARVDEELLRAAALVARMVPPELDEGLPLGAAARDALEDVEMAGRSVAIFDADGGLVAGTWPALPGAAGPHAGTVSAPAGDVRIVRAQYRHGPAAYEVGVAEPLAALERELAALRRTLLASVLLALGLALGGSFWIAHGALRPVALMAGEARRLAGPGAGALRLTAPNPRDELGTLAAAFNALLARVEGALAQQRRFMADASHELRTPVSVARTATEVTLGPGRRSEGDYRDALGTVSEQMRRLSRIVEDLFLLARADAAPLPLAPERLYLDDLVAECVQEATLLANGKAVTVAQGGERECELRGDERLLRRMLANLMGNAVRHSPAGGRIRVDLARDNGAVAVSVSDEGPGVAPADRERIFERFVRLDPARQGDGAGLGLPIARAIAEAHGGTLVLARSDPSGSTFVVLLPAPPPAG